MDIAGIIKQTGAVDSIAQQLGISPAAAQQGAAALLPAILGGFKKQASPVNSQAGLGGLAEILGSGGNLLDAVNSQGTTPSGPGDAILGEIFGSKDVSRTVAANASQASGLDPALLKKMLPLLVMAFTGYLAKQGAASGTAAPTAPKSGGILGQILNGVLGSSKGSAQTGSGPLGGLGGLGGLAALIDLDGDGNPLDDILGMAGKLTR